MRWSLGLAGIVVLLSGRAALAQNAPSEMVVSVPDVDVRSGPGLMFNATSRLVQGDRVTMVPDSKAQPGWVAIKPPSGAISWIEAKRIVRNGPLGVVFGEEPAPIRPGSSLTGKEPDRESATLKPGTLVVVVGAEMHSASGTWVPIQAPTQDVRYVLQEALRPAAAVAAVSNPPAPPSASGSTIITQADQAFQAGQIEQAKQLYRQALDRPLDSVQRAHCQNRLASLGATQPVNNQWAAGTPNL